MVLTLQCIQISQKDIKKKLREGSTFFGGRYFLEFMRRPAQIFDSMTCILSKMASHLRLCTFCLLLLSFTAFFHLPQVWATNQRFTTHPHSHVLNLDANSFDAAISSYSLMLVSFGAPWCQHFQSLLETLHEAAFTLHMQQSSTMLATVDASIALNRQLSRREEVEGFPTQILYKNGRRIAEYTGERNKHSILRYLDIKSRSPLVPISTLAEIESFCGRIHPGGIFADGIALVALALYIPASEGSGQGIYSPTAKVYESVANMYEQGIFLIADDRNLIKHFGVSNDTVLIFTNNHELEVVESMPMDASMTESSLIESLVRYSIPLTLSFNVHLQPIIQSIPIKIHALHFYKADDIDADVDADVNVDMDLKDEEDPDDIESVSDVHDDLESNEGEVEEESKQEVSDRVTTETEEYEGEEGMQMEVKANVEGVFDVPESSTSSIMDKKKMEEMRKAKKRHGDSRQKKGEKRRKSAEAKYDEALDAVAKYYRGSVLFIKIPSSEHQVMQYFPLKREDLPGLYIANMTDPLNMKLYSYSDFAMRRRSQSSSSSSSHDISTSNQDSVVTVTAQNVEMEMDPLEGFFAFFSAFFDNQLVRTLRSESKSMPLNKNSEAKQSTGTDVMGGGDNDQDKHKHKHVAFDSLGDSVTEESQIKTLVATNFRSYIMEDTNNFDFFVYFFAPWCGHCKSAEPVLQNLASSLNSLSNNVSNHSIKVVRVDSSLNDVDHPAVRIEGYPTFYLFNSKDKNSPIEYNGDRNVDSIVKFLMSFSSSFSRASNTDSSSDNDNNTNIYANNKYIHS